MSEKRNYLTKEIMEFSRTSRGFATITFKDRYEKSCSLQKSSLATEDAVWLGIDDPEPQIMASQAARFGVRTDETTGWVPYPVPEEVLISTRMHLTTDQVKALIPVLQHFVDTGELPDAPTPPTTDSEGE